ncbi:hypothetical protein ERO13_A03G078500v2 [Gossypium hirsutum]|uniref:RING-type E3 ubiquitin transferase n=3 Tax=Gossypium TaxID=3633 RepID=A0ABR0QLD6_GOSAR|nr:hypothetical protein ERO13_A03G078500v2 [Gossypium hirsutum]KAK5839841.1 hypothetical protein PVK06_008684 [Gossypium arboreum]TYH24525.1 hypothetical protein ES288_A03G099100v1 [Gossypium darwinii]TYI35777.1 hypothetical protein ES332_A03G099500v1 [Gossypium tomentosum]
MLPSLPSPFLVITILFMIYLVIFYLLSNDEESSKEGNESGLSMEEIEQLPRFYYSQENHASATTMMCNVCLDGFQVGERCRILPVCSHIFHTQCIDLWFLRRNTCPNCRFLSNPWITILYEFLDTGGYTLNISYL